MAKVLLLLKEERVKKYSNPNDIPADWELVCCPPEASDEEIIRVAGDADYIFTDAMRPVSGGLIKAMPNLKIIQSEGAGYNAIDVNAAKEHGTHVCNCAGCNAASVAEQAIMLMLGVLRNVCEGQKAVYAGKQMDFKMATAQAGVPELRTCSVGFVGFGAIAKETAARLKAFGCKMKYYDMFRAAPEKEAELSAEYAPLDEVISTCDIISVHVPVTPQTEKMINKEAFSKMKEGAILINTARGEIVDQEALVEALVSGHLGGAGLDVLAPEPVTADNIVLHLPEEVSKRVLLSPHIGGLSAQGFVDAHSWTWANFKAQEEGKPLRNMIV